MPAPQPARNSRPARPGNSFHPTASASRDIMSREAAAPQSAAIVSSAEQIYPAWPLVMLATWIGTIGGGMLFGLLLGMLPFLTVGPLAAITGFYGALLGMFFTTLVSLPLSAICTGLVRLLNPDLRTRRNYVISAAASGFLSGCCCFIGIWKLQAMAILPGTLGAFTAGISVLISARNSLVSAPAPPPVSTWGDLEQ